MNEMGRYNGPPGLIWKGAVLIRVGTAHPKCMTIE